MTSGEDTGIAAALARTRRAYDETPYASAPMMRSHPGRIAAQALWRGLPARDAERSRVLEIGCASGGNILPLADALPESRFLGVDLSGVQIDAAEARRLRYGLDNVELRAASFEDVSAADGEFDFIICHGVYSWIPEPLREALMRVVRARLAPSGIALVSFNVLPGWRLFQIARDSLLLHVGRDANPAERAEKSQDLFRRLAAQSPDKRTYGRFWRDEAQRMASGGDAYLAHEVFEEANAPETFADFVARAGRWGLEYLSESIVAANNAADLAPDGAESIHALAEGDRLKRETYVDIFSGRTFREALLVRVGRAAGVATAPPESALEALHFIPAFDLTVQTNAQGFRLGIKEGELAVDGLEAEPALRRLVERAPGSSRLADLVTPGEDAQAVKRVLRDAVETGIASVSTSPVDCAYRLLERPKASRLAALDATETERVVTQRHSLTKLAPLQRFLAPLMDGTRTSADLVAAVMDLVASGGLTVGAPDRPVTDPVELRARLEAAVETAISGFLRNALLVQA